jgi:5-deoxy-glucuronate isomerase
VEGRPPPAGGDDLVPTLHLRPPQRAGFTPVVTAGKDLRFLSLGLLRLDGGKSYRLVTEAEEAVLVLLKGTLALSGPYVSGRQIGPRHSVFQNRASAVYVPPRRILQVEAVGSAEAAVLRTPVKEEVAAEREEPPTVVVTPDAVSVEQRGTPGYRRQVHDLVTGGVAARRLLVGETFTEPGEWSSYPPHKHDERVPGRELPLEELYYFKVDPPHGFGVQVVYSAERNLDVAYRVQDGDVVLIPFGYHPSAAAPGYRLYYLWALAGEERGLAYRDDPLHAWVRAR